MAFHDAGVPGQCEAGDDGVEVTFEVLREVPQAGQVGSGGGRFDPGRQLVALEMGDHVPEGTHVLGKCRQFGAVGQDGFELDPVAFGQGVGWVRIHRVTARADGGRGPTGWGLPRRFLLT